MSISVAVLNLLPIPILDGGQVVIAVIESVRRKSFPPKTRLGMTLAGAAVLLRLLLLGITLINDGHAVWAMIAANG